MLNVNVNVNVKCSVYMSDLKTEPYNRTIFTVIGFHSFHVTSELPACGQENTLHSCLPLEFIQEPTTFHSISFNISALTLSDLGSKMLDSCCSVGCSNRRGDKPGFFFIAFKTRPRCYQLIVDVFWVNFSRTHSKAAILLGLAIKAQSPCSGRLIYQNNYLKREYRSSNKVKKQSINTTQSKTDILLGLAIKAQSPCSGRLIYQNNYLKREYRSSNKVKKQSINTIQI